MNPKIDHYLSEGCGRCPLGGTPECKVHNWTEELKLLRNIILDCDLTEELKWSVPTYTFHKGNILVLAAFKGYCSISFFKGTLLKDTHHLLTAPGENSQAARLIRFTNVKEIAKLKPVLKAYIFEAIEVEKAGLKVNFKKTAEPVPEELEIIFKENSEFKKAFYALTPGRQRGYLLHFSSAKQSNTRTSRIEKYIPKILQGKGMMD